MAFDPQQILNSRSALQLASLLGRVMPPRPGHQIADFVADRIAARPDWTVTEAVRINQWIVSGGSLEREALQHAVRETLRCSARSLFDLYHYGHDLRACRRLIVLDSSAQELTRRQEYGPRGLMLAGLHISNFDLALQFMCRVGLKALVLTLPDPQGRFRLQYEMRKKTGMNLVPSSLGALRQAVKLLQAGGVVLTGIDRPVPEAGRRPCFFGHPAPLPTHYIQLALKARVPVMIIMTALQPDGTYRVRTSDPIDMQPHPDPETEILQNTGRVLQVVEGFIQKIPQQWTVPLPVWPEFLKKSSQ